MTDQTLTIGRDKDSSIPLHDDEVSRLHCSIFVDSSRVILVDEDSSNGTFLNGTAVTRAEVQPGDEIRVGKTQLEFHSFLNISIDRHDASPLSVSPTRIKKNSLAQTKHECHSETDTDSINLDRLDSGHEKTRNLDEIVAAQAKKKSGSQKSLDHRVNNILQGISGGAHLVESGLTTQNLDLCRKGWEITVRNQNRIVEILSGMLVLTRPLELNFKSCDLAELISEITTAAKPKLDEFDLACQFLPSPDTAISVDRKSVKTCLEHLLRLVIDAARDNGTEIEFSITRDENMLHLCVEHPGEPIHRSTQTAIDSDQEDSGFGFEVVQKIVTGHNGNFSVRSARSPVKTNESNSPQESNPKSAATLSFPFKT